MPIATLKKAGGSLIVTVPASIRDALHLAEGQHLDVGLDDGAIVLRPARPRYSLEELVAKCDFDQPYSDEERAWLDKAPAGRELL